MPKAAPANPAAVAKAKYGDIARKIGKTDKRTAAAALKATFADLDDAKDAFRYWAYVYGPSELDEDQPMPPTPPTPTTGTASAQQPATNSTTTPAANTGTQNQKPPVSSADMDKASKLAGKLGNQPGLEKRGTLDQRVSQLIGTVGGSAAQAPVMSDLVSAELVNQGKIDPKQITQ